MNIIHNLKLVKDSGNPTQHITFTVITDIGQCQCRVALSEFGPEMQPYVYVSDYVVLGTKVEGRLSEYSSEVARGMGKLKDVCEGITKDNNWELWDF